MRKLFEAKEVDYSKKTFQQFINWYMGEPTKDYTEFNDMLVNDDISDGEKLSLIKKHLKSKLSDLDFNYEISPIKGPHGNNNVEINFMLNKIQFSMDSMSKPFDKN